MKERKLVVFDLDGTLNQTHLYATKTHLDVLKEYGIENISEEYIISKFGAAFDDYMREVFPDKDEAFKRQYAQKVAKLERSYLKQYGQPFPGIESMLQQLQQKGYILGVCSNASLDYIHCVLEALGLQQYIDYCQPIIKGKAKTASLEELLSRLNHSQAVMVGDRIFDLQAAKENNIPFIGCLYGYCPNELAQCKYLAQTPENISKIVDSIML